MNPDIVLTLNSKLQIVSVNNILEDDLKFEFNENEIIDKSIFSVFNFNSIPIHNLINEINTGRIKTAYATRNKLFFKITINKLFIENKTYVVFLCFLLKSNNRTTTENKLELLNRIIDYTDQMVWTVALPNYNTVFLNSAVERMYGYSVNDFFEIENLWYKCVYKEDRQLVVEKMNEVKEKKFLIVKHRIVHKSGEIRWIKNHFAFWEGDLSRPDYIHGIATDITDSVADSIVVESQTSLLNSLLENLPDMVFAKSLNGVYLKCNKEFEQYHNLPASAIIGLDDYSLFDVNSAKTFIEQDRIVMQTGTNLICENTVTHYSGKTKTFLSTKSPLRNSKNEIIGVIGVSRDITDAINTQKALNESEAKYRLVVNSLKEVVFQTNDKGEWLFLNPVWAEISGFTIEESLHKSFENFLVPYEIQKNKIYFRELLSRDRNYCKFETKLLTKNNEIKWVEIFAQLLNDNNLQPISVSGTITDISSRKEMEEKIFALNLLHSLINEISSLLIQSNFNEISSSINQALNMLGDYSNVDRVYIFEFDYSNSTMNNTYEWCAEGVTSEIDNLKNIPNNIIPRWFEKFNNNEYVYIPDVAKIEEEYYAEKEILEPQGIVSLLTIPIFFADKLIGFIGFDSVKQQREWEFEYIALLRLAAEIVSGALFRRNFECELMSAKELAERANASKSEFIANMSHEIRSPMNAILGFSEILLNMVKTPQEKNFVNNILLSGKTLLALINDILDLSKIESGRIEIFKEPVNLNNLIKEIQQIFSQQASSKNILQKTEINFDTCNNFIIDEIRLRQVVFNLVGNAVKFTDKGEITICANYIPNINRLNTGTLIIKVSDTGIGISREHFKLIFESFRQVANGETKKYGGTGLGLAISKRLVNLMGGDISVESEVNKGTTFIVTLNNIELSFNQDNTIKIFNDDVKEIKFEKHNILIIDDIDNNREIAKIFLTEFGMNVLEANSFSSALSIINKNMPTLILMDIRMPDINGIEASKKIRELKNGKEVKIIAFTASSKSDKEIFYEFNFDGILRKPLLKKDLLNILKKFIPHEHIKNDVIAINKSKNSINLPKESIIEIKDKIFTQISLLKETIVIEDLELLINDLNNILVLKDVLKDEIEGLQKAKENYDFEHISKILDYIYKLFLENNKT